MRDVHGRHTVVDWNLKLKFDWLKSVQIRRSVRCVHAIIQIIPHFSENGVISRFLSSKLLKLAVWAL